LLAEAINQANLQAITANEDLFQWYDEIDDVPPDVYDGSLDGDNSILRLTGGSHDPFFPVEDLPDMIGIEEEVISGQITVPPLQAVVVPFSRQLKLHSSGGDVKAVQRALRRAGFRKHGTTGYFGTGTKTSVQEFQVKKKLTGDGVYGRTTHAALAPYFDAFGIALMRKAKEKVPAPVKDRKLEIEAAAIFGYNHRYQIHYTQSALRMYGLRYRLKRPTVPIWEDCSSFATWCYYDAEFPKNPNGYAGWPTYGYTGTLAVNGMQLFSKARAALGLYGSWPFSHVVISVGTGQKCVSHGSEGGPYLTDYYYRGDFAQWRGY
jgi:peptidoglycan hydrolase-like protein with peptidoglycan-binding domain